VTAFALLDGQAGETMNLDLSFFVNHFYSALYALALNPDVELSHRTLRLDDPLELDVAKRPAVNISTEMEMVIRIFESIFLRRGNKSRLRAEAFGKRLATGSLHLPEKSTIASLKIFHKMMTKFGGVKSLFSTDDRVANGVYHPEADVPEHSNPEAATIWETALLEKHYSPKVSQAALAVLRSAREAH
jgi:nucleolar complex protein 3